MTKRKVHLWLRMSMLGKVMVQCGRTVSVRDMTPDLDKTTCEACINAVRKKK